MKRRALIVFSILFCLPFFAPAQTAQPSHSHPHAGRSIPHSWKQVPIPPLHPFKPQQPKRVELPNGMVIFLQEDHELPLIDGVIRIRGGSRDVPESKTGFTSIYADAWRTGGTAGKTGDQLDDFLESRAARVETFSGVDSTFLSWSTLKEDFDKVFPVVLDLLEHPEFRENKIELAKRQLDGAIARRNDDVDEISGREATKLAYGADNPYARTPEFATVAAIKRQDLLNWHKHTIQPNNMILGITGDFNSDAMERKLREAFGGMPRGRRFVSVQLQFHGPKPGIYLIKKTDVNQSDITLVDLGTDRLNPDYYAIVAMNEILGGGFSSRLFSRLRTKEGLAYSVGGGVGTSYDHPGISRFGMGTKSGTTAKGIEALQQQIKEMIKGGVTREELKRAKDSILNSFIFEFDSKDKVLAERMRYEFYGYPPDFLEKFRQGLEKVTTQDVDRVARKYLHPEKMAILVVGNPKDFDRDLATLGKVTPIDITIPPPKKPEPPGPRKPEPKKPGM